jgi:hypothetical protein
MSEAGAAGADGRAAAAAAVGAAAAHAFEAFLLESDPESIFPAKRDIDAVASRWPDSSLGATHR